MLNTLQINQSPNQAISSKAPVHPAISKMMTVAVTPRGYAPPVISNHPDTSDIYVYQPQNDPKKKFLGQALATMIVGAAIGAAIALGVTISQNGGIFAFWTKISPFNKSVPKTQFIFLADSAFSDLDKANDQVKSLKSKGYNNAAVFSVSGSKGLLQQVYVDYFPDPKSCLVKLVEYKRLVSDAYCALATPDANIKDKFSVKSLDSAK